MVKMIKTAAVLIVLVISQCESQDSQNGTNIIVDSTGVS
jgi:hypothetical protein